MAQNHYQWTSERVITASSPSKKEAGMHEISSLDHLAAKVDALTQKFDKRILVLSHLPLYHLLVKFVVYLAILMLIAS